MNEKYMSKAVWAAAWTRIKGILDGKVDKEGGKGLSTNDYTAAEKNKLAGIEQGANKTTIVDALNSASPTSALSAAQGKKLDEKIAKINTDIGNLGGGDMMQATYDPDGDGVVDDAAKLGGALPASYAKADGTNIKTAFTAASTRANIATGETLPVILGKVAKFFTDLKSVAFTGSYTDLTNKPAIPTVTNDLTNPLKSNYDAAYTHSQSPHAPSGAQANVIEEIKVNGVKQSPVTKSVNITVPTTVAALKDAGEYAKKSDLTNVYKYQGSVATKDELPKTSTVGHVYNVEADGMNWAWNGTAWDNLGAIFTIQSMTETDLDEIMKV